jgi:hypothetical protein
MQSLDSSSNELLQLPNITPEQCKLFKSHGVTSLDALVQLKKDALQSITRRVLASEGGQGEFLKVVNELPVLAVSAKMTVCERRETDGASGDLDSGFQKQSGAAILSTEFTRVGSAFIYNGSTSSSTSASMPVAPSGSGGNVNGAQSSQTASSGGADQAESAAQPEKAAECVKLIQGKPYEMKLSISVLHGNSKASVFCPMYHRSKIASYWCILGTEEGQLLAMRKVIPSGGVITCTLPFELPGMAPASPILDTTGAPLVVNSRIPNPNDKLYMNYAEDYKQQQESNSRGEGVKRTDGVRAERKTLLLYLISDSVMGLDDAVTVPYQI